MAHAFDTLGYAQRLREAGVPPNQAEAHAAAARDFVMAELVTRTDLQAEGRYLRQEIVATKTDLQSEVRFLKQEIEGQTNRLTVRLGGLLVAGIAVLAAILKLA